jgi:hypothetical protein
MLEVSYLSLLGPGAWDQDDGSGAAAVAVGLERRKIPLAYSLGTKRILFLWQACSL